MRSRPRVNQGAGQGTESTLNKKPGYFWFRTVEMAGMEHGHLQDLRRD